MYVSLHGLFGTVAPVPAPVATTAVATAVTTTPDPVHLVLH